MSEQQKKWEEAKQDFLKAIKAIDDETPWTQTPPQWWLSMSYLRRILGEQEQQSTQ